MNEMIIPDGHKYCPVCNELKPVSEFNKSRNSKNVFVLRCIDCTQKREKQTRSALAKAWWDKNKTKINLKNDEGYYKDEFEGHKKCGKCKEIKPFSSFHKHKSGRFGLRSACKDCANKRSDAYKERSLERYRRDYDAKHGTKEERDKRKKERHDQYIINKKQKHKEWLEKNKDEIKKKRKERYFNNREDAIRKHKEWRSKNKEHLNEVKRLEAKELRDNYIKREIRGRSNINRNDIPQSLIETYRELLKVKRLIKTETL